MKEAMRKIKEFYFGSWYNFVIGTFLTAMFAICILNAVLGIMGKI
jgi:hypothetical protein